MTLLPKCFKITQMKITILYRCFLNTLSASNIVYTKYVGGSRTPTICKMKFYEAIVNKLWPVTVVTKSSILNLAWFLDLGLVLYIH